MKLKTIITLSSLGLCLTLSAVICTNYFTSSYNSWKKTYDAVMEEKELVKYENFNGVYVKDISLEEIRYRPCYVISGVYDAETVNPDTVSFKLYTHEKRANFAEIVYKEIDTKNHTIRMYADVSMTSANGDGKPIYNNDSAAVNKLADTIAHHAYYPSLVVDGVEKELVNTKISWHGETLEFNNCTYTITHNANTGAFPFGMPALLKTTSQEIPSDASYTATGVEFCQYDDDVCFIINGTSQGYNRDTLSKDITFELRTANGSGTLWGIRDTWGGPVVLEANGDFKLYVRLNNVPNNPTNAYYTRFGNILNEKNDICDLVIPGINGTTDQQSIIQDGREYTIYIQHGSSAANGYNTTGVFIKDI